MSANDLFLHVRSVCIDFGVEYQSDWESYISFSFPLRRSSGILCLSEEYFPRGTWSCCGRVLMLPVLRPNGVMSELYEG